MPDFWALSYIPFIFISHAKIRVFSRLCKHSWGIPSPARFFLKKLFGSSGACGASGNGVIRRGHMEKTTSTTFTTMNKNQATEETKSSQLRKSQKKAVSLHWHI